MIWMGIFDFAKKEDDKPIAAEELQPFINSIAVSRERLFVRTILYTGINPAALAELRWFDIDFSASAFSLFNRKLKRSYQAYVPSGILADYKILGLDNGTPIFGYTPYTLKRILESHSTNFFGRPKSWHAIRLTYLLNAKLAGERLEVVANNMAVSADSLLKYWHPSPEEMRRNVEMIR